MTPQTCLHGHLVVGENAYPPLVPGYKPRCRTCARAAALKSFYKRAAKQKEAPGEDAMVPPPIKDEPGARPKPLRLSPALSPNPAHRPWTIPTYRPSCGCCHRECCPGDAVHEYDKKKKERP